MIRPQKERSELIKDAAKASDIQVPIKFKKNKYACKQIIVDEKNLIYRVNNTRVGEDLEIIKATENKNDEHFSVEREENQETQEILHNALEKYIGTLEATYEREGELDPIWIDPIGRVINGNRRLRFYRDISKDDITCILLDHGYLLEEGRDLEIEAEQDGQTEDKVKYKWTSWGLNYKKLSDSGQSLEKIANDRSIHKNEVDSHITGYKGLKEWLEKMGIPNRFDLAGDNIKQIWLTEYPKAKKRASNETDKDIAFYLAGLITFVPEKVVGVRKYEPYAKLMATKYKDNLIKNLKINLSDTFVTNTGEFGEVKDIFSIDTAIDKIKNNEGGIDVDSAGTVYDAIKRTKADQDDLTADDNQKKAILKCIGKMNSTLETTLPHLNNYDDLEVKGAMEQINAVEEKIVVLKNYIKDHS